MNFISKSLVFFLTVLVFYSCGKDISNSDVKKGQRAEQRDDLPSLNKDPFISKQELICEDAKFCPDNIAKLVVRVNDEKRFCTGTLIAANKILTSASCLPRSLQIPYLSCEENIVAIFPRTPYEKEIKVRCKNIEYVDENFYSEPSLWKSDIAVLSLVEDVPRTISEFSNNGINDSESLLTWKVALESEYLGVIKQDKCQTQFNSYLNPFVQHPYSPFFVGSECGLDEGSVGSALFRKNKLVGVYSKEMSQKLYKYLKASDLLKEELDRYYHFTNLSCSKFFESIYPYSIPKECHVETSTPQLDALRANMLKGKDIHMDQITQIQNELDLPRRYFLWNLKFLPNKSETVYEMHFGKPKCIYKAEDWIYEFRRWGRYIRTYARVDVVVPSFKLFVKLDKNLKPVSVLKETGEKTFEVEFNPFEAYVNKLTYVTISSFIFGQEELEENYEEISASCSLEN
ncbi:MAG: trypsin-like serine protease [Bacteriovoracaceae bacterium]|jgi:hypothetical protein|nr:trypsin-like serine protease [Bacteriovoracaceae bacterium]